MKVTANNWKFKAYLLAVLYGSSLAVSYGMPANPSVVPVKQPNGAILNVVTRGDEFQGWQETTDGYTVVKNTKTGYFEYASNDTSGNLIPSGIVATPIRRSIMGAPGLRPRKGLRPRRNIELERSLHEWINSARSARIAMLALAPRSVAPAPGSAPTVSGIWAPKPVVGPKNLLVILVNFTGEDPDAHFKSKDAQLRPGAPTYWSNAVFGSNGNSVVAYYRDNSYGKVTIAPVHHHQPNSPDGVITISLPEPHPNYGNQFDYATESAWVNRALAAAGAFVDFPSLDTNGDGTISVDEALIYFVIGGYETAAGSGLSPSIWAHRWGGSNVAVSGKNINNWALNGDMYDANNRMQMGVIAHEMGHAMGGLPDLYDTSNTNAGLGAFSVMASGSWGATSTDKIPAATPVGMDAWSRQYLGWSTPRYPANGSSVTFPGAQSGDVSSAVMLMNPTVSTSEYWLVENRPPAGWDAGMYQLLGQWQGGLLIQHIDANIGSQDGNSFNAFVTGSHQGNVAVEPSTATCHLLQSSDVASCPTILFYSGNAAVFDNTSTPPSYYYSSGASSLGINSISVPGTTMSATIQDVSTPSH